MKYVTPLDDPDMPYIAQTANADPKMRQVGIENTIAKSGCGLCTSVMIADRLRVDDGKFEIEDARQLSYDCGANQWSGTRGLVYFPAFAEKFNLELKISADIADRRGQLNLPERRAVEKGAEFDALQSVKERERFETFCAVERPPADLPDGRRQADRLKRGAVKRRPADDRDGIAVQRIRYGNRFFPAAVARHRRLAVRDGIAPVAALHGGAVFRKGSRPDRADQYCQNQKNRDIFFHVASQGFRYQAYIFHFTVL